jgi:long-chain acyl-CoA synthetase
LAALGLVAGDVVGILMRNDFPVFEVALAAERIGVVAVPLNWHGTPEEIGYILADSQARALFAHTDLLRVAASAVPAHCRVVEVIPPPEVQFAYRLQRSSCTPTPGGFEYEAWVGASAESSSAPMPPPFLLLYTSGTTGRPKGVKRFHQLNPGGLHCRLAQRGVFVPCLAASLG